ncbi:MAG TPA: hypothetical protein DCZ91_02220 [Lachnospiraceae bacterium]|nr:hypothetical protein [Lachnospiraceae bacterium]
MILFNRKWEDYRKNLACMQEVTDRLLGHMKGHGCSFRKDITDSGGEFSQDKLCGLVKEILELWAEALRESDTDLSTGESVAEPYIRERRELYGLYLYLVMRCSLCQGAYAKAYPYGPVSSERTDFAFLLEQARRLSESWCVTAGPEGDKKNELYEGYDEHFGFHLYKTITDPEGRTADSALSPWWDLPRDRLGTLTDEGNMKRFFIRHLTGPLRGGKAAGAALTKGAALALALMKEDALAKKAALAEKEALNEEAATAEETGSCEETDMGKDTAMNEDSTSLNKETATERGAVCAEGAASVKPAVRAEDAVQTGSGRSEDEMSDTEGYSGTGSDGGYDGQDSYDSEDDCDGDDSYEDDDAYDDYDPFGDYDDDDPYPFPDFKTKAEFETARMDQWAEEYERADYLMALSRNFACEDAYLKACRRFAALFEKARPDILRDFYQELEEIVNLYLAERNLSPLTDTDKTLDVYSSVYDGPCQQAGSYERRLQWENQ